LAGLPVLPTGVSSILGMRCGPVEQPRIARFSGDLQRFVRPAPYPDACTAPYDV